MSLPMGTCSSRKPAFLSLAVVAMLGLVGSACKKQQHPATLTDHGLAAEGVSCNPLDSEWDCLYPYPSNFYLYPDSTMPGGTRVGIPSAALPTQNINRSTPSDPPQPIDFLASHPTDGFSVMPQIGVLIAGGVDTTQPGLVSNTTPLDQLDGSQLVTSPTLIIDAETGDRILHFAEIDPRPEQPQDRALLLRPMSRLQHSHRYIVVLQHLKHPDGTPVAAPDGFRRIRDQVASGSSPQIVRAIDYYNDQIFPVLTKLGIQRKDLVLAWDLTTESAQRTMGDMFDMRTDLLKQLDATPPAVTLTSIVKDPQGSDGTIAFEIRGTFVVPNYMDSTDPGSALNRGPDGKVVPNGTYSANLLALIPRSVVNAMPTDPPARVIQYGHGFFGSANELINGDYPAHFADQTHSVLVATDWLGMSIPDAAELFADLLQDTATAFRFSDRVHQGMADFIGLNYAIRRTLADASFTDPQGNTTYPFHVGGSSSAPSLYDTTQLYYYGISQGCILGSTYLSLAPAIERGVCGVGGASFGLMMSRASPFLPFLGQIEAAEDASSDFAMAYPDQAAQIHAHIKAGTVKLEMLSQTTLDRIDPAAYLIHEVQDPLPGNVAKKVLYQIGIGDAEVPNLASHLLMRSLGLPQLEPVARHLTGIQEVAAPLDGSAMVEWDFRPDIEPPDLTAQPSVDNPVHNNVRWQPAAIQQIDAFLRPDGTIQQFCPPPNACHGTVISP